MEGANSAAGGSHSMGGNSLDNNSEATPSALRNKLTEQSERIASLSRENQALRSGENPSLLHAVAKTFKAAWSPISLLFSQRKQQTTPISEPIHAPMPPAPIPRAKRVTTINPATNGQMATPILPNTPPSGQFQSPQPHAGSNNTNNLAAQARSVISDLNAAMSAHLGTAMPAIKPPTSAGLTFPVDLAAAQPSPKTPTLLRASSPSPALHPQQLQFGNGSIQQPSQFSPITNLTSYQSAPSAAENASLTKELLSEKTRSGKLTYELKQAHEARAAAEQNVTAIKAFNHANGLPLPPGAEPLFQQQALPRPYLPVGQPFTPPPFQPMHMQMLPQQMRPPVQQMHAPMQHMLQTTPMQVEPDYQQPSPLSLSQPLSDKQKLDSFIKLMSTTKIDHTSSSHLKSAVDNLVYLAHQVFPNGFPSLEQDQLITLNVVSSCFDKTLSRAFQAMPLDQRPRTWSALLEWLLMFHPQVTDPVFEARNQFIQGHIKQKGKSLSSYIMAFNYAAQSAHLDVHDQIGHFINGLNDELRACCQTDVFGLPFTNMQSLIMHAHGQAQRIAAAQQHSTLTHQGIPKRGFKSSYHHKFSSPPRAAPINFPQKRGAGGQGSNPPKSAKHHHGNGPKPGQQQLPPREEQGKPHHKYDHLSWHQVFMCSTNKPDRLCYYCFAPWASHCDAKGKPTKACSFKENPKANAHKCPFPREP